VPAVEDNAAMHIAPSKAEPPKRKRRWFQFSLWTLMIGVTVLAVACGYLSWKAKTARDRAVALTIVHKLGGLSFTVSNDPSYATTIYLPAATAIEDRRWIRTALPDADIWAFRGPPLGADAKIPPQLFQERFRFDEDVR
jgi:hypothetical protein